MKGLDLGQRVKAEGFGAGTVCDVQYQEMLGFVGVLWDERPPDEYCCGINPANHRVETISLIAPLDASGAPQSAAAADQGSEAADAPDTR